MTVIALSIDFGATPHKFATHVAERLGVRLLDTRRLEIEMAEQVDRADGAIQCVAPGRQGYESWAMTNAQLACRMREQALIEAAHGNVLIVGHTAPFLLRDVGHAVRVRIGASADHRVRNVMRRRCYGDARTAELEIQSFDAQMQGFVRRTFGAEWSKSKRYDLVINTARIAAAECITMIESAAEFLRARNTDASRAALEAELASLHDQELKAALARRAPVVSRPDGQVSQGPGRRES